MSVKNVCMLMMALLCLTTFTGAEWDEECLDEMPEIECERDSDCREEISTYFCDRALGEETGECREMGNATMTFERTVGRTALELVSSWQAIAGMALVISIILVAVAYMVSKALDMPQLQAWAGTEMGQIFANAILVVILIVVIGFIDSMVMVMVNQSDVGGLECHVGEACLHKTVVSEDGYIPDMISSAKSGAKNVLENNMEAAAHMNRRAGLNCITIYCLMAGINMPLAPQYILDVDRNKILFEYWTSILSSLHSQKFFVDQICFKVGPLILAIGIVARSFFMTRKLGGLLVAIAAGLMFFFPMMYVFDWMTLDMTVSGDNAVENSAQGCPPECSMQPPLAYYLDDEGKAVRLQTKTDVNSVFAYPCDEQKAMNISKAKSASEVASKSPEDDPRFSDAEGKVIHSCYYEIGGELTDTDDKEDCPAQCRELPYPQSLTNCTPPDVQKNCAELSVHCKVKRIVPGAADDPEYLQCPDECKIIPPLRSNCNVDGCLDSRFDCRMAKYEDREWRPEIVNSEDFGDSGSVRECELASECPAPEEDDANQSCVYIIPDYGPCDDLCSGCPDICRIEGADLSNLPEECFGDGYDPDDPDTFILSTSCQECSNTCKVDVEYIEENLDIGNCSGCPMEKRILTAFLPEEYLEGDCSVENCPTDTHNRAEIPLSSCESCLFSEESYIYNPPVQVDCGSLCKPSNKVPSKSPGEYAEADEDGLIGKAPIVSVSKYIIPAYLLPLFNIVATLVFIKGFSAMLGGDITIPGIKKVF